MTGPEDERFGDRGFVVGSEEMGQELRDRMRS